MKVRLDLGCCQVGVYETGVAMPDFL